MIINFRKSNSKEDLKRLFTLLLSLDYSMIITPTIIIRREALSENTINDLVSYYRNIDQGFRIIYDVITLEISIFPISDKTFLIYEDVSEYIKKYKFLLGDKVWVKQENKSCKVFSISVKFSNLTGKYQLLYNLKELGSDNFLPEYLPESLVKYSQECVGYQCLICSKIFEKPMPHNCNTGFVKHKLQFNPLYTDMKIKIPSGYRVCFSEESNFIKIVKE